MKQLIEVTEIIKDPRRNLLLPGTSRLTYDYLEQVLSDFLGAPRRRVVI